MNDTLKIFKKFQLLRPNEISGAYMHNLSDLEKYRLSKTARVWGYINSLAFEIAKDLELDTSDKSILLNASLLIHNSIFEQDDKKTEKSYNEMFRQMSKTKVLKEIFAEAAKDAMRDMLNIRNNVKDDTPSSSISNFPRLDNWIISYCRSLKDNK